MNSEFQIRKALNSEADIIRYKACFDNNDSPKKIESIKWLLFNNKKLWIQFAFSNDDTNKVAAIIAALPLRMKYFDKQVYAGQFLDTMTDKDSRGKGLFTLCAKQAYDALSKDEGEFAWGFPNINAAHGWFNKLGWKEIAPVPFLIKPLQSGYLKTKLKGVFKYLVPNLPLAFTKKAALPDGYEIEKKSTFDKRHDNLWDQFAQDINIAVIRDSTYLNWRYIDKPDTNYNIYSIVNEKKEVECLIITCVKAKHNGNIGYIMELMYNPANSKIATTALQIAINDVIKEKADVILTWAFPTSKTYKIYSSLGFYKLPKFLQFIKLYFGARIISEIVDENLYLSKNWYISYSDSDTV